MYVRMYVANMLRSQGKTECHALDDRRWLSTVSTLIIAPNKIVQQLLLLLSRSVGGRQGTATAPIITFVIFEFDSKERRRTAAPRICCCAAVGHRTQAN